LAEASNEVVMCIHSQPVE